MSPRQPRWTTTGLLSGSSAPFLTSLASRSSVETSPTMRSKRGATDVPMSGPMCPALGYVMLGWQMPEGSGAKNIADGHDPATDGPSQDVDVRLERRCSAMQDIFERRASMGACRLHVLEFYEYEMVKGKPPGLKNAAEKLITSSRRDDPPACLARLREVVGALVVYRGYLITGYRENYRFSEIRTGSGTVANVRE